MKSSRESAVGQVAPGQLFGAIGVYVAHARRGRFLFLHREFHALAGLRAPARLRQLSLPARQIILRSVSVRAATMFLQSGLPGRGADLAARHRQPMGLLQRCHAYKEKVEQGLPPTTGCSPIRC